MSNYIPSIIRDERGLLEGVKYEFSEDGFIDWRNMINNKYLYPNKGWFEKFDKPVPKDIDGLKDHQLLIKLGGIKDFAKLRGYKSIKCCAIHSDNDFKLDAVNCTYKCVIEWIPNMEFPDGAIYEDVGSVNVHNADNFSLGFADSIAYNRALVRCVRNFLGIYICGEDEINKSPVKVDNKEDIKTSSDLIEMLQQNAVKHGFDDFGKLKFWATKMNVDLGGANSYEELPPKNARIALAKLKKIWKTLL
ncbi:MAG: hypothetical protein OEZ09_13550 [Betaproteobacteria bacterium]|nr:hypothetical protein [Betaproteobacteria bacterium]